MGVGWGAQEKSEHSLKGFGHEGLKKQGSKKPAQCVLSLDPKASSHPCLLHYFWNPVREVIEKRVPVSEKGGDAVCYTKILDEHMVFSLPLVLAQLPSFSSTWSLLT